MAKKSVFAVGIDPALADYSAFPELTPEKIAAFINAQLAVVSDSGYEVESCLIDLGETAESKVTQRLKERQFDCIMIGAGLRVPPEQLILFEKIINVIHLHAPRAKICFNTKPGDTIDAVRRWV